jgi:hypothetical protein
MFLIGLVSSETQFWQIKDFRGNGAIQNRLVYIYSKGGFGIQNDYVIGNDPFEAYLQYDIYPQTFNRDNPNFKVKVCNLKIQVDRRLESGNNTVFDQNYTDSDSDIRHAQYFFQLYDGDQVIATQTCYYQNQNFHELVLPAEMLMVSPTSECKACQYYLWTKQEADISKTQTIGNNVVTISEYVRKLVILNFEIILALFWIFLILMLFVSVGLIFVLVYWLFLYLNRLAK